MAPLVTASRALGAAALRALVGPCVVSQRAHPLLTYTHCHILLCSWQGATLMKVQQGHVAKNRATGTFVLNGAQLLPYEHKDEMLEVPISDNDYFDEAQNALVWWFASAKVPSLSTTAPPLPRPQVTPAPHVARTDGLGDDPLLLLAGTAAHETPGKALRCGSLSSGALHMAAFKMAPEARRPMPSSLSGMSSTFPPSMGTSSSDGVSTGDPRKSINASNGSASAPSGGGAVAASAPAASAVVDASRGFNPQHQLLSSRALVRVAS
jgi:hypothetical protein